MINIARSLITTYLSPSVSFNLFSKLRSEEDEEKREKQRKRKVEAEQHNSLGKNGKTGKTLAGQQQRDQGEFV